MESNNKEDKELVESGKSQNKDSEDVNAMSYAEKMRSRIANIETTARENRESRVIEERKKYEDNETDAGVTVRRKIVDTKGAKKGIHISPLGIAAFVLDLISGILVIIFTNTLTIVFAAPFAILAVICSYVASKLDSNGLLAALSGIIGIILFIISVWPLLNIIFMIVFLLLSGG